MAEIKNETEHIENNESGSPIRRFVSSNDLPGLINVLQNKIDGKEFLDEKINSFGIIRHGKTENIDNEGDSQKSEQTGLSESEFNAETSYVYMTAQSIVDLGYKKVKVYAPRDTLRNQQTQELLMQYIQQIDNSIEIEVDQGFDGLAGLHARKQFTADVYEGLLNKNYLLDGEKDTIREWQGKKHVSGENRRIDAILSETSLSQLKQEDAGLFAKIDGNYEESYSTIVDRAGKGVDQLRKYVASCKDPETFHAVIAYRTTLQATDQVMKSNKEVKGTNNFFDIGFAQMNVAQCDEHGNSLNALTMNSYKYDEVTYEDDIAMFHEIQPDISLDNDVYQNISKINIFLSQTELYFKGYLGGDDSNKKILRRQNLLEWTMKQKLPPVMARRIIETILTIYKPKKDADYKIIDIIDNTINAYIKQKPVELEKLLELLSAYCDINNAWKSVVLSLSTINRNQYRVGNKKIDQFIESEEKFQNMIEKEYMHTKIQNQFGSFDLEDVFVPVEYENLYPFNPDNQEETSFNNGELIRNILNGPNDQLNIIYGPHRSGVSTGLKSIHHTLLENFKIDRINLPIKVTISQDNKKSIYPNNKGLGFNKDEIDYYKEIIDDNKISSITCIIDNAEDFSNDGFGFCMELAGLQQYFGIDDMKVVIGTHKSRQYFPAQKIYAVGIEGYCNSKYETLLKKYAKQAGINLQGIYIERIQYIMENMSDELKPSDLESFLGLILHARKRAKIEERAFDKNLFASLLIDIVLDNGSRNVDENRNPYISGYYEKLREKVFIHMARNKEMNIRKLSNYIFNEIVDDSVMLGKLSDTQFFNNKIMHTLFKKATIKINNNNISQFISSKFSKKSENENYQYDLFDIDNISENEMNILNKKEIPYNQFPAMTDNIIEVVRSLQINISKLLDSTVELGIAEKTIEGKFIFKNNIFKEYYYNQTSA